LVEAEEEEEEEATGLSGDAARVAAATEQLQAGEGLTTNQLLAVQDPLLRQQLLDLRQQLRGLRREKLTVEARWQQDRELAAKVSDALPAL
jgi:hypothetical protein